MKKLEEYIKVFDIFGPNISIRYNKQYQYKTVTSAIGSICVILLCCVFFFSKLGDTINRTSVTTTTIQQQLIDPSYYNTTEFMFALSLDGLSMRDTNQYFNIVMYEYARINNTKTKIPLQLQFCELSQWAGFGPQFAVRFNVLQMQNYLCPKPDQIFVLQGKYSSQIFRYYQVNVGQCTGPNCMSTSDMTNFLAVNESFSLQFYFARKVLNPQKHEPISYTLEDSNYFTFTPVTGTTANIYFQDYTMKTDNSLTPFPDMVTDTGMLYDTSDWRDFTVGVNDTQYCRLHLRKSPKSLFVTRKYYSYTDLFAYIGGLFGIMTAVGRIIFQSYNILCYELSLATTIFVYKSTNTSKRPDRSEDESNVQQLREQAQKVRLIHSVENFNFLTFLGYLPYVSLKGLGIDGFGWQRMEPYFQALKSIKKEIDISRFLERFIFYDRVAYTLLDEDQINILHVKTRNGLEQFEADRKKYKYHKLMKPLVKLRLLEMGKTTPKQDQVQKILHQSYLNLLRRQDAFSQNCIKNIDPFIKKRIFYSYEEYRSGLSPDPKPPSDYVNGNPYGMNNNPFAMQMLENQPTNRYLTVPISIKPQSTT